MSQNPAASSLFKEMAHQYILKYKETPFTIHTLDNSQAVLSLDLSHLDSPGFFENLTSLSAFSPFAYHRPIWSNLPGIDSLAFKVNEKGDRVGVVVFQCCIFPSEPVNLDFFKEIWGVVAGLGPVAFVFVVPEGNLHLLKRQPFKLGEEGEDWGGRVERYG